MKTYYVLIRESARGNYYIKVVKAKSSKEVEHRYRSFGYIVNRVYTEKSLREAKARGKEFYLKHKIAHVSAWEVIEKFEIDPLKRIKGKKVNVMVFDEINEM